MKKILAIVALYVAVGGSAIYLYAFATHSVLLHWNPPSQSCVTVVNIFRCTNSPGCESIAGGHQFAVASTLTSFTDTTVVNGNTYEYKVGFYGAACGPPTDGPLSIPAQAVIPNDPQVVTAPGGFTATVQ
jgi:hypothetical protein